jgi:hypothetical protein
MSPRVSTLSRLLLWIALGGWLGAMLLFAAVVAPAAFRISTEVGGRMAREVLPTLHLYGLVAGPLLAVLACALGRGPLAVGLPLAMTALGLFNLFGITPLLEEIRQQMSSGDPDARARFLRWHAVSGVLYLLVGLGGVALGWLHAAADVHTPGSKKG